MTGGRRSPTRRSATGSGVPSTWRASRSSSCATAAASASLANRCCPRGGPLDRGEVADGCVTCPWHGSTFRLEDGSVVRGPAAYPQPAYDVRVLDGGIGCARWRSERFVRRRNARPGAAVATRPARRACPVGGGRRRRATPIAAMKTKNAKKPIVETPSMMAIDAGLGGPQPAGEERRDEPDPADHLETAIPGAGDRVRRHDDAPVEHVPGVVDDEGEVPERLGRDGQRRSGRLGVDVRRHDLVGDGDGDEMRDRHEGQAEDGEDRRLRISRPARCGGRRRSRRAPPFEEAAEDRQPCAHEEGAAGLVHVGDPLERLVPGLRDEDLHAASGHQRNAGDLKQATMSTAQAPPTVASSPSSAPPSRTGGGCNGSDLIWNAAAPVTRVRATPRGRC